MQIGVPKEIKPDENRVALTPEGTARLVQAGHLITIETDAGAGSGFTDDHYAQAGATVSSQQQAWNVDLVLKVKEPIDAEYPFIEKQIIFTYLHLAGVSPTLTATLLDKGTTAIAYETVEDESGGLPLLAPMSAVAGNMAVTMGNYFLARFNGGRGMLLSQIFSEPYGNVLVIGDGVVGKHSARTAAHLGANVSIVGRHPERLNELRNFTSSELKFVPSEPGAITTALQSADLLVGAVLHRGGRAPHIVSEEMVRNMQPGAVIVDVSIDQGGCVETAVPTTHSEPVYEKHGVIHYCVSNMPGAYPRLSTIALTKATLPYVVRLARGGIDALRQDEGFAKGLNTYRGKISCLPVAEGLGLMDAFSECPLES